MYRVPCVVYRVPCAVCHMSYAKYMHTFMNCMYHIVVARRLAYGGITASCSSSEESGKRLWQIFLYIIVQQCGKTPTQVLAVEEERCIP